MAGALASAATASRTYLSWRVSRLLSTGNGQRSTVQARVEQMFAQQQAMGRRVVRTIGVVQAWFDIRAMNLAYNLRPLALGHDAPGPLTANEAPVADYAMG